MLNIQCEMFSNKMLPCLRELWFSLFSYIRRLLTLPTPLQKAVLSPGKIPGHWGRRNITRLFPDCYLALTNCCHTGMMYPSMPGPLIDHKKPKCRFYIKYSNFFSWIHWPNKKTFVAQIWSRDHTFATSTLKKKNESILYLENTKI